MSGFHKDFACFWSSITKIFGIVEIDKDSIYNQFLVIPVLY